MKKVLPILKKEYKPSSDANNYYQITCPFCGHVTPAQVRGYHARGRKCEMCDAMFKGGIAIRED